MPATDARRIKLLVYSSSPTVRERVRSALGTRPAPDVEIDLVEVSTGAEVVARCDEGDIDVAILDGEAAPTGGLGLCRQLKDELDAPPPVLVLGRRPAAPGLGPGGRRVAGDVEPCRRCRPASGRRHADHRCRPRARPTRRHGHRPRPLTT